MARVSYKTCPGDNALCPRPFGSDAFEPLGSCPTVGKPKVSRYDLLNGDPWGQVQRQSEADG